VDEARAVLTRLRRIDALEREQAPPELLLAELRELVRAAEEWVRAEPGETGRAQAAIARCRRSLEVEHRPARA
jgi:hypothetical protein